MTLWTYIDDQWHANHYTFNTIMADNSNTDSDFAKTLAGRTDGQGFDLVFVGDGFTADEMPNFRAAVESYIGYNREYDPVFKHHQNAWNIHSIEMPSNESGVDEPKTGTLKDTVFGSSFECSWVDRVICVDQSKVLDTVSEYFPQYDAIMVIANSRRSGGASLGNRIVTSSMSSSVNATIIHELGHVFASLADEYTYGGSNPPQSEPSSVNITINSNVDTVKWKRWVDFGDGESKVNFFEGGQYVSAGVWRPSNNSVMRNLGRPFHAVNLEAWTLALYQHSGTYFSTSPSLGQVSQAGASQVFEIELSLGEGAQQVQWFVNNQRVDAGANESSLLVDGMQSDYEVQARISDKSLVIRQDTKALSSSTLNWQISVN